MKINVDLQSANNLGSGISVFENELVNRLVNFGDLELHGCVNYIRACVEKDFSRFPFSVTYSYIPLKIVSGMKMPFSYECMMHNTADINLFFTYSTPNVQYKKPVVSCIHDLIPFKTTMENPELVENYRKTIMRTNDISEVLMTVSQSSKNDLIEYLGIPEHKIRIVYNGVEYERFAQHIETMKLQKVREKYHLPEHFILYLGGLRKHKNIDNLIRAYAMLPKNIKADVKLVLTKSNDELHHLISELHIETNVYFTGFIDEGDKTAVYRLADVFSFVSLYEGFGVPIIEAQAAGVPVITSNISSMPEAAGDAALLVDPKKPEEISNMLEKIINDSSLRDNLVERGKNNARKFNWDTSANVLHQILLEFKK